MPCCKRMGVTLEAQAAAVPGAHLVGSVGARQLGGLDVASRRCGVAPRKCGPVGLKRALYACPAREREPGAAGEREPSAAGAPERAFVGVITLVRLMTVPGSYPNG